MERNRYFETIEDLLRRLEITQKENIHQAAELIAHSIMAGGILQSFGSGHSYAAAIEVAGRAGGLFAAKVIKDPAMGIYEVLEGSGTILMRKVEVLPDCLLYTSFQLSAGHRLDRRADCFRSIRSGIDGKHDHRRRKCVKKNSQAGQTVKDHKQLH